MKCKYITRRTKKYTNYWFCRFYKKRIDLQECYKCSDIEAKKYKEINNKSKRLANAEKKRFSILTDDLKYCYICGAKKRHIHEIYGGRNRQISMRNGFCIPICDECHKRTEIDMNFDKELKRECQRKFEEVYTRDEFLRLIDKNYLN